MSFGVCDSCVELRELLSAVARGVVVGERPHEVVAELAVVTVQIDRELWDRIQMERNP